jgi:aldehyde dehydrogenase (NAD+)
MIRDAFFIAGEWRAPSGTGVIRSVSSATGDPIGMSPDGCAADVDAAVEAAARAFPSWRDLSRDTRANFMEALAVALEKRITEIGHLVAQEVGTPVVFAGMANATGPARHLRYYASLARTLAFEEERPAAVGRTVVRREPLGVAGLIVPWNYPIGLIHFKLAPALAAGCTAVIKPSPETALSSYLFAEAVAEAGLPPGVVNVVPGGRETGAYLVQHPQVDKVAFTGSTAAGRQIASVCGQALKPVTLELGGKSAAVLLDDAPLDAFLGQLGFVCLANNGQTCVNNTRILAPRHRYDEVVDAVTATVAAYRVGDPLEPETVVGPVVSQVARQRIEDYIASGREQGAQPTVGGGPSDQPRGWFVQPTVFRDVTPHMTIAREEIFGPVLCVLPYDGGDVGAIAAANDSRYGLAGTVWTADPDRGLAVARRIDSGSVGVNLYTMDVGSPFGGHKASGLGYELGPEGLQAFFKLTSIYLPPTQNSAS